MRVVANFFRDDIKISIFDFDLKFVIKFESRGLEQTFKVDKLEYKDLNELENKINQKFLDAVNKTFSQMSKDLNLLY